MLTALLGSIQNALTSFLKGFVVVALLPTAYFVGVNLLLISLSGVTWADKTHLVQFATDGLPLTAALVVLCAAAFVLTTMQPWLLQALEGEHLPGPLRRALHRGQADRLDALRDRAEAAFFAKDALAGQCNAAVAALAAVAHPPSETARRLVQDLWERRREGLAIEPEQIAEAIQALTADPAAGAAADVSFGELRRRMHRIATYARDRSRQRFFQTQTQMQFRFPGDVFDPDPSSDNVLAPTAFGNIGRTMRSYALRRYSIDLDIFWTRFQKAMADSTNKTMFETLQTQKALVDFTVTMFWLTLVIACGWIPWLSAERLHPRLFRVVTVGAPSLVWVFYQAACRAYLLFADHVRTAVDFFRFDVIRGFHLTDPAGTLEEQILWERLGNQIGYANRNATFLYARQQQQ